MNASRSLAAERSSNGSVHRVEPMTHGEQCSCRLLAQALGRDPEAISFGYCSRVLQRHWRMTCHHKRRYVDDSTGGGSQARDWAAVVASAVMVTAR